MLTPSVRKCKDICMTMIDTPVYNVGHYQSQTNLPQEENSGTWLKARANFAAMQMVSVPNGVCTELLIFRSQMQRLTRTVHAEYHGRAVETYAIGTVLPEQHKN